MISELEPSDDVTSEGALLNAQQPSNVANMGIYDMLSEAAALLHDYVHEMKGLRHVSGIQKSRCLEIAGILRDVSEQRPIAYCLTADELNESNNHARIIWLEDIPAGAYLYALPLAVVSSKGG